MNRALALIVLISVQAYASTGSAKTALKLRSQPTTSSEAIGSVSEGTSFEILDQQGDFYHVNSNGQVGFIAAKYVAIEKAENPRTLKDQVIGIFGLTYLLFGLVVGEVMIRSYMMRFFNSLSFISISRGTGFGSGAIGVFLDFLERKIFWEVFVALLSTAIGCAFGPFYVVFRVFKSKHEQSFEIVQ